MAGVRKGVEITTLADIPSAGSGLGSSSAVTVGLLHALFAYAGPPGLRGGAGPSGGAPSARALRQADRQAGPVRRGVRRHLRHALRSGRQGDRRPDPPPEPTAHRRFQSQLMLFYTGITRSADTILLRADREHRPSRLEQLHPLRDLAGEAADELACRRPRLRRGGPRQDWEAKRAARRGRVQPAARRRRRRGAPAGATGAKVAGAGGGGFVLVSCPLECQTAVRGAMGEMKELPIKIDQPTGHG